MAKQPDIRYMKRSDGGQYGLMDRALDIYIMKTCVKGELWNSGVKGWKSKPRKPLAVYKGKTVEDVVNQMGFSEENRQF